MKLDMGQLLVDMERTGRQDCDNVIEDTLPSIDELVADFMTGRQAEDLQDDYPDMTLAQAEQCARAWAKGWYATGSAHMEARAAIEDARDGRAPVRPARRLEHLRHLHMDAPAAWERQHGIVCVEPGDMTHYEVWAPVGPGSGMVRAEVGEIGTGTAGLIMCQLPGPGDGHLHWVDIGDGCLTRYTRAVLEYLCKLAVGIECDEPGFWAARRGE